jgi:hypothetical protein
MIMGGSIRRSWCSSAWHGPYFKENVRPVKDDVLTTSCYSTGRTGMAASSTKQKEVKPARLSLPEASPPADRMTLSA